MNVKIKTLKAIETCINAGLDNSTMGILPEGCSCTPKEYFGITECKGSGECKDLELEIVPPCLYVFDKENIEYVENQGIPVDVLLTHEDGNEIGLWLLEDNK